MTSYTGKPHSIREPHINELAWTMNYWVEDSRVAVETHPILAFVALSMLCLIDPAIMSTPIGAGCGSDKIAVECPQLCVFVSLWEGVSEGACGTYIPEAHNKTIRRRMNGAPSYVNHSIWNIFPC